MSTNPERVRRFEVATECLWKNVFSTEGTSLSILSTVRTDTIDCSRRSYLDERTPIAGPSDGLADPDA